MSSPSPCCSPPTLRHTSAMAMGSSSLPISYRMILNADWAGYDLWQMCTGFFTLTSVSYLLIPVFAGAHFSMYNSPYFCPSAMFPLPSANTYSWIPPVRVSKIRWGPHYSPPCWRRHLAAIHAGGYRRRLRPWCTGVIRARWQRPLRHIGPARSVICPTRQATISPLIGSYCTTFAIAVPSSDGFSDLGIYSLPCSISGSNLPNSD